MRSPIRTPDEELMQIELFTGLEEVLKKIDAREEIIFEAQSGLLGEKVPMKELAQGFGVSDARIQVLHQEAVHKLRFRACELGLDQYMNK